MIEAKISEETKPWLAAARAQTADAPKGALNKKQPRHVAMAAARKAPPDLFAAMQQAINGEADDSQA
jgi:hypothetical protein